MGMKKQNVAHKTTVELAVQKGSQSIAKIEQKIRIIYIQTPEIIKIEPADFQSYVQSLTGKSTGALAKLKKPEFSGKEVPIFSFDESSNTEARVLTDPNSTDYRDRIASEQERTSYEYLGGGSAIGSEEFDKFIAELTGFPLISLDYDDNWLA